MSLTQPIDSLPQVKIVFQPEASPTEEIVHIDGFSDRLWTSWSPPEATNSIVQKCNKQGIAPLQQIDTIFHRSVSSPNLSALRPFGRDAQIGLNDGRPLDMLPPVITDRFPRLRTLAGQFRVWEEQNNRQTEERIQRRLLDESSPLGSVEPRNKRQKLETENSQPIRLVPREFVLSEKEKEGSEKRQKIISSSS